MRQGVALRNGMVEDPTIVLRAGLDAQQNGNVRQAERLYRQVLASDSGNRHALNLLGALCTNTERSGEAVGYITRALAIDYADPQAHANIGLAYKDLGMAYKAADHLAESVRLDPSKPVVFNNFGNVLRLLDQPGKAIRAYDRALRLDSRFAECWSNLAAALNESGQHEAGLRAAARALELSPGLAQAHNHIGDICLQQARYDDAVASYRKAASLGPGSTVALINLAKAYRDRDEPEKALKALHRAFEIEPGNPEAFHVKGVLLEQMGDREGAAEQFKSAIRVAPEMAISHYYLAQIKGRRSSDEEFEALNSLWDREGMTPNNRMYLAFAIARIHERQGNFDEAYRFLAAANRTKAAVKPYDDADSARYIDAIVDATRKSVERFGGSVGHRDTRPVFVVGMPRSGTSLTEQILASHSEVAGAGELSFAFDTVRRVRKITGKKFPQDMEKLSAEQIRGLGAYYMSRHTDEYLSSRYVVDKSPLNFQYVGPLALILPDARFVHCLRHPAANCFAIHRIPFDLRQTYAHSLEALGKYYTRYWNLMQQWHELFPGRILDVRYEDTVTDIEGQARRMLDFLQLPFEEQVLNFHETKRLVKTPSASQVREPIYKDALALWKNYSQHLEPLMENLRVPMQA